MYTRKQYLNNECTHSEYYSQFITPRTRLSKSLTELVIASNDNKNFNDILLNKFDSETYSLEYDKELFKQAGGWSTLAEKVCNLKEKARQNK